MLRQYVKGKFTMWLLVVSLALLSGCAGCPGGNDARQMFFDRQTGLVATHPHFTIVGLTLPGLPEGDDTRNLERARERKRTLEAAERARREGRMVIAPPPFLPSSRFCSPWWGLTRGWTHCISNLTRQLSFEEGAKLLDFLVNRGYLEVEVVTFQGKRYYYYLYTDKIKEHKVMVRKRPVLKLAERVLRSIDYSHQWEEGGRRRWAITFSYTIRPTLPELPRVNRVFEGGAEAFLNPRTGQWVLRGPPRLPLEREDISSNLEITRLLLN